MKTNKLTIGWLYPNLMNTYGDRGNIIVLKKRCEWRKIKTEVKMLNPGFATEELKSCNFLLMGGAQDRQQKIVNEDLKRIKKALSQKIEDSTPGLYVCGGFQFLGKYYKEADGTVVNGLGILDLHTESPGDDKPRLIGNLIVEANIRDSKYNIQNANLVGFENHGGRTYLGENVKPLGKVIKGFGNNGDDGFEGAKYKNSFGTYMHGPILPKNPSFTDYLIKLALDTNELSKLDDTLELQAHYSIAKRLSVNL